MFTLGKELRWYTHTEEVEGGYSTVAGCWNCQHVCIEYAYDGSSVLICAFGKTREFQDMVDRLIELNNGERYEVDDDLLDDFLDTCLEKYVAPFGRCNNHIKIV